MTVPSATQDPSTDAQLIEEFARPTPRRAWRILARNQARSLFDLVREAEGTQELTADQKLQATLIRENIWRAVASACYHPRGLDALKDWYSGSGIETAWAELHRASERLLLVQGVDLVRGRITDIDTALRSNLKADDPRLTPATANLAKLNDPQAGIDASTREQLRHYQEVADTSSDEAHTNVRSLRNLLIVIGFCLCVVLALLAVLHAIFPSFLDLNNPATVTRAHGTPVWQVEIVGAFGGAIAAVFTIAKLGGFGGPYRLPVYQSLIRIPTGSAVALAAVVLVQSRQISALTAQEGLNVLAVALLFGYAPDVLLRFMDQKATSLLGQAQSKDDPTRPPLTQPLAPPP